MDREINSYAILKNVDTTPFVAFRAFADYPEIVCGFSTRLGGVSTGCWTSMNLSTTRCGTCGLARDCGEDCRGDG